MQWGLGLSRGRERLRQAELGSCCQETESRRPWVPPQTLPLPGGKKPVIRKAHCKAAKPLQRNSHSTLLHCTHRLETRRRVNAHSGCCTGVPQSTWPVVQLWPLNPPPEPRASPWHRAPYKQHSRPGCSSVICPIVSGKRWRHEGPWATFTIAMKRPIRPHLPEPLCRSLPLL